MSRQSGVESPRITQVLEVLEKIRKANPIDIAEVSLYRKHATEAVSEDRGINESTVKANIYRGLGFDKSAPKGDQFLAFDRLVWDWLSGRNVDGLRGLLEKHTTSIPSQLDLDAIQRFFETPVVDPDLDHTRSANILPGTSEEEKPDVRSLELPRVVQTVTKERAPSTRSTLNLRVELSQQLVACALRFTDWQLATFYTALQTKGFVILSGISGTGKTRLAQAFAGMLPQPAEGANHLFVTVRPDWRDSKSLLGYYNPLTGAYEWTLFLRFLLRVEQNYKSEDKLAWFVILDEMNLAHVEYYFADLLSVLESGRDEDGWTREPLRLGYPDEAEGNLPPRELKLPPNLYIVGTVNVDETTHAFSPKVLDRAFTLELTDVDFTTYPIPSASTQPGLSDQEREAILKDFARNDKFARVEKPAIMAYVTTHPEIRDRLQTLKDLLRPHDLHFGYRVFDEIVAFLAAAESNKLYDDLDGAEADFDAAVLMKVLPKFHGSRSRLETPLCAVMAWCADPGHQISRPLKMRSKR